MAFTLTSIFLGSRSDVKRKFPAARDEPGRALHETPMVMVLSPFATPIQSLPMVQSETKVSSPRCLPAHDGTVPMPYYVIRESEP